MPNGVGRGRGGGSNHGLRHVIGVVWCGVVWFGSVRHCRSESLVSLAKDLKYVLYIYNLLGLEAIEGFTTVSGSSYPESLQQTFPVEDSTASFRFVSFRFVSFRFVSFRFVSFRFVSFRFVSFRFVSLGTQCHKAGLAVHGQDCRGDGQVAHRR